MNIVPDTNFFIDNKRGNFNNLVNFKNSKYEFIIVPTVFIECVKSGIKLKSKFQELNIKSHFPECHLDLENFSEIRRKSFKKLPPFQASKSSDPGFKDSMIWEEVIIASKNFENLVFISGDEGFISQRNVLEEEFKVRSNKDIKILDLGEYTYELSLFKISQDERDRVDEIVDGNKYMILGFVHEVLNSKFNSDNIKDFIEQRFKAFDINKSHRERMGHIVGQYGRTPFSKYNEPSLFHFENLRMDKFLIFNRSKNIFEIRISFSSDFLYIEKKDFLNSQGLNTNHEGLYPIRESYFNTYDHTYPTFDNQDILSIGKNKKLDGHALHKKSITFDLVVNVNIKNKSLEMISTEEEIYRNIIFSSARF